MEQEDRRYFLIFDMLYKVLQQYPRNHLFMSREGPLGCAEMEKEVAVSSAVHVSAGNSIKHSQPATNLQEAKTGGNVELFSSRRIFSIYRENILP